MARRRRSSLSVPWPVDGHEVSLLRDGAQAFPVMLDAIRTARQEVLLEMYWFASDSTGLQFSEALCSAAKRGVRVCILYDAVGSVYTSDSMFERMRKAGCEVVEFNPIAPWRRRFRPERLTLRDHRKMLVVDGIFAVTGGVNIGNEWAPADLGGGGWRDDMVSVRGPSVQRMRDVFEDSWCRLCEMRPLPAVGVPRAPDVGSILLEGGADTSASSVDAGTIEISVHEEETAISAHHDGNTEISLQEKSWRRDSTYEPGGCKVQVLATRTRRAHRGIRETYLAKIRGAKRTIVIANAYFLPDWKIRTAIKQACARGVKVRLLLPGRSDIPAVHWATRHLYHRLLKWGVEIYEWRRSVLHTKSVVVDQSWASVGTYNMDYLSWLSNLEIAVGVEDAGFARKVASEFDFDIADSVRVSLASWRHRPLLQHLLERFFFAFRKFL